MSHPITRRTALAGAAALPLAGLLTGPARATRPRPLAQRFAALEAQYDARLGVLGFDTGRRAVVAYRADEPIAFCSTWKTLGVGAFLAAQASRLDEVVHYTEADLVASSPITSQHVVDGMSYRALADAAIRYSDNTAGNLVLRAVGGPPALTRFVRRLGDPLTRSDRYETALNTAIPGDQRDTTTARALAADYLRLVLGRALEAPQRALLTDLLVRNTTGGPLIRAGAPAGWRIGDKSGAGEYATRNDVAILWPPRAAPIVLAVLSTRPEPDAVYDNQLVADAASVALGGLA